MSLEISFEKVPYEEMDRILERTAGLVQMGFSSGNEGYLYGKELDDLREKVIKPLNEKFSDSILYSFDLQPRFMGGASLKVDLPPILSAYEVFSQFYDTFRRECAGHQPAYVYENHLRTQAKLDVLLNMELKK